MKSCVNCIITGVFVYIYEKSIYLICEGIPNIIFNFLNFQDLQPFTLTLAN
jgi:hypothetical protein